MTEFKLPIQYNDKCMVLDKHIVEDLELNKLNTSNVKVSFVDEEPVNHVKSCWTKVWCKPNPILKLSPDPNHIDKESIFDILFNPSHRFGKKILVDMTKYYSYDKKYIKSTQKIVKKYTSNCLQIEKVDFDMVLEKWNDIKGTKDFKDKYNFMTWKMLEFVNNNDTYLQFLSLYTLATPVLALLFPIFILIIPFFIIKLKGLPLTVTEYYSIMKGMLKNHSIGKILFHSSDLDIAKKAYLLLCVGFYFFSVYQNFATFVKFISNFAKIHDYLFTMKDYITHVLEKMNHFKMIIINVHCYSGFCNDLNTNILILTNYLNCLQKIKPNRLSYKKVTQIGYVMKQFYDLNYNEEYNKAIQYSFDCVGFLDNIEGFSKNITKYNLGKCKFGTTTHFKKMSYPPLLNSGIKNDISLEKQMILTGPNASGKTTILKSVLINILISQQMGYGCYSNGIISLYRYIHSYLNIPDTSGRDSLFQAEARRCKEIVENIKANNKFAHFCIFDEIYSGTNPEEAILSASAFMTYISEHKKVDSILTTHYIELCHKLEKNTAITNFQMGSIIGDNSIKYSYLLKPGISNIKGGIQILNDMNYPKEILDKI